MLAIRRSTSAAITAAVIGAVALAACGKDGKDSKGSAAGSAAVKAAFAVFPADSDMVVGVTPPRIKSSPLFSMAEPMIKDRIGSEFAKLHEVCGVDPFGAFTSVLIGGNSETQNMVAVVQGMTRSTLTKCGEGLAKAEGERVVITHEGKVTKVVTEDETVYLVWLDDKTFLTSDTMSKDELIDRAAGKNGLDGNAEMLSLLREVDSREALWLVAKRASPIQVNEQGIDAEISAAFGTISLASGLGLDFGVRTASGEQASKVAKTLDGYAGLAKGRFKQLSKLEIKSAKRDLIIKLSLTVDDIKSLVDDAMKDPMLQQMLMSQLGGGGSPF